MPTYDAELFEPPAPVARVTLRQYENGGSLSDVPMLIDVGADITLVPVSAISILNIPIETGDGCKLKGFDGTVTTSQVVQLDLVFLRRKFRGRYALTDEECGILGRDVLNHLSLLFDGPRLTWEEHKSP